MEVLRETNFDFLGPKKSGKVRDVYEPSADSTPSTGSGQASSPQAGSGQGRLILVTTDRHSSFDRIIAHVPHKGQVLNQITAFWMNETKDIVPNALLEVPDPNVMVAKKCALVPVEAVVRGYNTGVTGTSIWTRYSAGQREFGGITLPDGMKKNEKLPIPIFDPTTKEDTHDRALSEGEMIAEGLITAERFAELKDVALKLFARGQELTAQRGLILVDTKYEFGTDPSTSLGAGDGKLVLIDEVHTPDSSRYWQLDSYAERMEEGAEPQYFDKEFLRLWFKEHCDPYKDEVLPEAPEELIEELARRYIGIYEQITGAKFAPGEEPIAQRIERNLQSFAI